MTYDAVVCAGPHHLEIASLAIRSLQLFTGPGKIYVITAARHSERFRALGGKGPAIVAVDEDTLIECTDLEAMRHYFSRRGSEPGRAGWYFQQFLKMSICQLPDLADNYLIWDCDTVLLRPLSFFDREGKPLVNPTHRYHPPYFDLLEKLLGYGRLAPYSFISEHLMVKKSHMRTLIEEIRSATGQKCWPVGILDLVSDADLSGAGFSEFETYGNFMFHNYPGSYGIRRLRSLRSGAKKAGPVPGPKDLLCFSRNYDYVSFEVWTRSSRLKHFLWKLESGCCYAFSVVKGLLSKKTRLKVRQFNRICS